jgi:NADH-quinone oxidoreductase subunit F
MDLRFSDAEPTAAERNAVDAVLGVPESSWEGAVERSEKDLRSARLGRAVRERRDELLPALGALQSEIGWISEGGLMHVCRRLSVPPADAYGVATFYALLSTTERPRRVVHICDDVGCAPFGANQLMSDMAQAFGAAGTVVNDAMWVRSPCLGQCDAAPACYGQLAGDQDITLTNANAVEVVEMLSSGSTTTVMTDVPQMGSESLSLLSRVGRVDPTSLEAYRADGGYLALAKAIEIGPAAVVEEVKASNIRGRGGAAFPAGVKWESVLASDEVSKYLICNADESEPGTFKDRAIMEGDPFSLVESMTITGIATGCQQGYLYIRGEYPLATTRLQDAITAAYAAGLLGANVARSGLTFDLELRRGQGAYVCGEETALMNSIEGYRGEPRNKPPFPTVSGLFEKPTVINNVETLVNIPAIVLHGGAAFAETGTADSTGPKLFCLSGAVAVPGVYEVDFGATLGDLITLAGGATDDIGAILLGGAAGTFVTSEQLDVPLTFEGAHTANVSLGSGVIMIFPSSVDMTGVARRIAQFFRDESCGQCVPCRVGTVRVEEALARALAEGGILEAGLIDELDRAMKDASICGLGHTAASAIQSAISLDMIGIRA